MRWSLSRRSRRRSEPSARGLSGDVERRIAGARGGAGAGRTGARGSDGDIGAGRPVEYRLRGAAGQSLGAFAGPTMSVVLDGVANDYVAKGLSGGSVVVRPAAGAMFEPGDQAIAGNACLYGATGGRLHLIGRAGIRFAVRNSGATAVAEGVGAHGCEYMTGGTVVVLGPVGGNFGAGMTGGRAWLWDPTGQAESRLDPRSVVWRRREPVDVGSQGHPRGARGCRQRARFGDPRALAGVGRGVPLRRAHHGGRDDRHAPPTTVPNRNRTDTGAALTRRDRRTETAG